MARPKRRGSRRRYAPTSRPSTRLPDAQPGLSESEAHDSPLATLDPVVPYQIQIPDEGAALSAALPSLAVTPSSEAAAPSLASTPNVLVTVLGTATDSEGNSASLLSTVPRTATSASSTATIRPRSAEREGRTKIYCMGYEYTRANATGVKITYRCSYYRKPKLCPAQLVFYAETMTYDFANMIHHTCRNDFASGRAAVVSDESVCLDLTDEMKSFVDELVDTTDESPTKIWELTYRKFYENSVGVIRGLNKKQIVTRINNGRAAQNGKDLFSMIESPSMAKVKNEELGFLQFNCTWLDDTKVKQEKPEIDRLIGWAHPELRNLLRYEGEDLFVDGTFRSAPKGYHQVVTLMMYDPLTELLVPLFFTLTTSKTQDSYKKFFYCVKFAVGKKPSPIDIVCDFEAAIIFAIREHFPKTKIIGCLFHFKQACRRKMKAYWLPDDEAEIAMAFGVLDMLTVVNPDKISVRGVAWVKAKIKQRCEAKGVPYSREKWRQFWQNFERTWLEQYPPELWNIFNVERKIVNQTNNPLERFHRELNARLKRQPSLKRFVKTIEKIAQHYVILRRGIISGVAQAPARSTMRFPRAAKLPKIDDIEESDSENEDAAGADSNNSDHIEAALSSDEDLELLYDTSFENEEATDN
ncbi:hypothetical protein F442_01334 [Phytophthora nicotianae P10297]|uniref:Uncharacterized protein n=1 Tax=Phytophthora nicotianae P10297 TaxID=1317064 RepID=W3A5K3_PHYNI|nr:hypothetical protein F442_01334 [Phytophthora nicotianae P10297]